MEKIHPFRALMNDKGISRSAERDQRPTALDPCRLLGKAGENLYNALRAKLIIGVLDQNFVKLHRVFAAARCRRSRAKLIIGVFARNFFQSDPESLVRALPAAALTCRDVGDNDAQVPPLPQSAE